MSTRCSSNISRAFKMPYRLVAAESSAVVGKAILAAFPLPEFEVHFVKDQQELEAALEEIQPDAILLSLSFSGKNAYELGQHLRERHGFGRVPLILLHGAFDTLDKPRLAEAGFDEVVPAPFDSKILEKTVRALIEGGKDPQTLPEDPDLHGWPEEAEAVVRRLEARLQRKMQRLEDKLTRTIVSKVLDELQRGKGIVEETESQDSRE